MVYMAYRYRKDIVGKRFLCVHARCQDASSPASPKQNCANKRVNGSNHLSASCTSKASAVQCRREPASWHWRAGVVRAATHRNTSHPELQVNMISTACWWTKYLHSSRPLLGHFVSVSESEQTANGENKFPFWSGQVPNLKHLTWDILTGHLITMRIFVSNFIDVPYAAAASRAFRHFYC
jgi:hypothetical protein